MISLLIIAAIFKSVMDNLQHHYHNSIFKTTKYDWWFNPNRSWYNKYKRNNPALGEWFWGSTTIFSFLTDAWHFAQMLFLTCLFAFVVLFDCYKIFGNHTLNLIANFIFIKSIFTASFQIFYTLMKRK